MTKAPCILFPYNAVMCNVVLTLKIPVKPGDMNLTTVIGTLTYRARDFILDSKSCKVLPPMDKGDRGLSQLFQVSPSHGDRGQ